MAERIERFSLVAAAGASNLFQDHTFLDGIVTRVELYVPPGHAGLTSWSLWYGSGQLVPVTSGSTVVADDQRFEWDLEGLPTGASGGSGSGYRSRYSNSDVFPHSFYIECWVDEDVVEPPEEGSTLPVLVVPFVN